MESIVRNVRDLDAGNRCSPAKMLPTAGACGMEQIERSKSGKRAGA